jgi:hypothetical protein
MVMAMGMATATGHTFSILRNNPDRGDQHSGTLFQDHHRVMAGTKGTSRVSVTANDRPTANGI